VDKHTDAQPENIVHPASNVAKTQKLLQKIAANETVTDDQ